MANDCFIGIAMVQANKKDKEETVKRLWNKDWLKKRDELKLISPNDFLNCLPMDEGTHKELLNLVDPKFQKRDT